jgi:hypothetical protein
MYISTLKPYYNKTTFPSRLNACIDKKIKNNNNNKRVFKESYLFSFSTMLHQGFTQNKVVFFLLTTQRVYGFNAHIICCTHFYCDPHTGKILSIV